MDPEYRESFATLEWFMKLIGQRIFYGGVPTKTEWLKKNWFFMVSCCQLMLTVIMESIRFGSTTGFLVRTEQFACLSFCFLAFTKMGATATNSQRMESLFEEIEEMWPKGEVPIGIEKIKRRSLKRLVMFSKVYTIGNLIFITIFFGDPIIEALIDLAKGDKCHIMLPLLISSPIDLTPPVLFELSYLYCTWSGFISSAGITAQDCLFQTACSHIAMLLETLQYELMNVVPDDYSYSMLEDTDESVLVEKLGEIVRKHQKLIKLTEILDDIYTLVNMVNVVCVSLLICLVGFQSTVADTKQLIKHFISTCSQISQALVLAWHGNLLIEKSELLRVATFRCKWYNAGPIFKKNLYFIMLGASKPIKVTAMKFSIISLNTFTSIAKTSWSYFTLLQTVYNP